MDVLLKSQVPIPHAVFVVFTILKTLVSLVVGATPLLGSQSL